MKVLHFNTTDKAGGAAIACWRLHEKLLLQGFDSRLLVGRATETNEQVAQLPGLSWTDAKLYKLTQLLGLNEVHRTDTFDIVKHDFFKQADLLHLHNLHVGYFNYLALPKLTNCKPAILTLHDMWPITGHCAFSASCSKWQIGCGACPSLDSYPKIGRDGTWLEWRLKKMAYQHSNLAAIVVTSRWSERILRQSMLRNIPVHFIPLGIDTDIYAPIEMKLCRRALHIEVDKRVIMCSAQNFNDFRKGGDLLIQALNNLPSALTRDIVLLTMGRGGSMLSDAVDIPVHHLGFIADEKEKAIAYSAADVFVCPSREETFGMVALEALSCGTPVVGFEVGGMPELIKTGLNGYLANCLNATELAEGISQCLNTFDQKVLSSNARSTALAKGRLAEQVRSYTALYKKVIG